MFPQKGISAGPESPHNMLRATVLKGASSLLSGLKAALGQAFLGPKVPSKGAVSFPSGPLASSNFVLFVCLFLKGRETGPPCLGLFPEYLCNPEHSGCVYPMARRDGQTEGTGALHPQLRCRESKEASLVWLS